MPADIQGGEFRIWDPRKYDAHILKSPHPPPPTETFGLKVLTEHAHRPWIAPGMGPLCDPSPVDDAARFSFHTCHMFAESEVATYRRLQSHAVWTVSKDYFAMLALHRVGNLALCSGIALSGYSLSPASLPHVFYKNCACMRAQESIWWYLKLVAVLVAQDLYEI